MLQVPAKFVEGAIHSYRQTCKRARNCLDGLVAKTYTVEKKKRWFGKDVYEVNIFGEHKLNHDTPENMLEIFLRDDKISPMDYQLLNFMILLWLLISLLRIFCLEKQIKTLIL